MTSFSAPKIIEASGNGDARGKQPSAAFSLVELLIVIAIMVILMALLVPAFTSFKGAGDMTKSIYDISGLFEQARAYAIGHSTYVFVGITEVDASVSDSATPQTTATATAGGRVAVALVASRDGTRGYDTNNPGDGSSGSWVTNYSNYNGATTNGANLVAISKLQRFENLHFLVDFPAWSAASHPTSGMGRASPLGAGTYSLGNVACKSVTPFTWPLGSPLTSGYQYKFEKVINFDPQGIPRIQYNNGDPITQRMEIDFQPTHGNSVPAVPTTQDSGNIAALQIDGLTGETRMYRP